MNVFESDKDLTVLILDDHEVVRRGIKSLIRGAFRKVRFIEFCEYDSINKEKFPDPEIVFLDLKMPEFDPIGLVINVRKRFADSQIIVFTMLPVEIYASRLMRLGISSYIHKSSLPDEILKAVESALLKNKYVNTVVKEAMVNESLGLESSNQFSVLTDREFQILHLVLDGKPIKEIAKMLDIASNTCTTHKNNIFKKLNVSNIVELTRLASFHDLL